MLAAFAAGLIEPSMRQHPPCTDAPDGVKVTFSSDELRRAMEAVPPTVADLASGGAGIVMYSAVADAVMAWNICGRSAMWSKESYPLVTAIQFCDQVLASLLYPAAQMRPVEGQNSNSITR